MVELEKARKIANFAINPETSSYSFVKTVGLSSWITNQVLRKYSRNKKIKKVHNVMLIVPGQAIRRKENFIHIRCLQLRLDGSYLPYYEKINQIEIDREYAYVTVTINEMPVRKVDNWLGVDLNSTGHLAVVGDPRTGKVQKLGKEVGHIHKKYNGIRRNLQMGGNPGVIKNVIKKKEKNILKDLNHKISRKIVDTAVQQDSGIKMERLSNIRANACHTKSFRTTLNSWPFYQLQQMVEYKAKLLGVPVSYVSPFNTSRQCSRCGQLGIRRGKEFICSCGHVDHADANASFNIALRPSLEEGDWSIAPRQRLVQGPHRYAPRGNILTRMTSESTSGVSTCPTT